MADSNPRYIHLRVLILGSSPLDAEPAVDLQRDIAALRDALRALPQPAEFVTRIAEADSVAGLLIAQPFDVLHYLGHGDHGALLFEDERGFRRWAI
jgi:hypothetical protein